MSEEEKAYNDWLAKQDKSRDTYNRLEHLGQVVRDYAKAKREVEHLRAENAELKALLNDAEVVIMANYGAIETMRTLVANLSYRLDKHTNTIEDKEASLPSCDCGGNYVWWDTDINGKPMFSCDICGKDWINEGAE